MTKRTRRSFSLERHRRTTPGNVVKFSKKRRLFRKQTQRHLRLPSFGKLAVGSAVSILIGFVFVIPVVESISRELKPIGACKISRVIDGDTISMFCAGKGKVSYRLIGFDTPEKNGDCESERFKARVATYYLRWLLLTAKEFETVSIGLDRYDRELVTLFVDGVDVADLMIGAGLARPYDGGVRGRWCKSA